MARIVIQDSSTGEIKQIGDVALPFFPGWVLVDTIDDEFPPTLFYTGAAADARYVNVAEISDPDSPAGVALRAASVAAVEDAAAVTPAGAWDFAQAPTVAGVAIGTGSGSAPDATPTTKGVVRLAGDLGGTAAAPTVPGLAGKANSSHAHPAADLTATGTRDATTFLRGDGTWAVPAGGGGLTAQQIVADPTVKAALAPRGDLDQRVWPVGRRVGWLGASVTNSAGASNTVNGFQEVVSRRVGSAVVRPFGESINGGVAGETSTQIAARAQAVLNAGAEILVLGPDFGTNSAGSAVSVAQFKTDVAGAVSAATAAGVPVLACTTIPRAAAATEAIHDLTRAYNLWLRLWCPAVGIPLVDTHAALADPATGYLAAANNSGDGVHPNDAGHAALAARIGTGIAALVRAYPWPAASGPLTGFGLMPDPLNANTTINTSGAAWWQMAGGAATAALANPVAGDGLPAGKWFSLRVNNTAGGAFAFSHYAQDLVTPSGFSVGDKLLVCFYAKWTGQKNTKVQLIDQSNAVRAIILDGLASDTGVGVPFMTVYTVQSGVTALKLGLVTAAEAGQDVTQFVGAADVFNLTAAGLSEFAA